jgi:hypothetical protein
VPKEAILQEEASRKRAADFWELNMKYSLVPGSNAPEGSSDPFMVTFDVGDKANHTIVKESKR